MKTGTPAAQTGVCSVLCQVRELKAARRVHQPLRPVQDEGFSTTMVVQRDKCYQITADQSSVHPFILPGGSEGALSAAHRTTVHHRVHHTHTQRQFRVSNWHQICWFLDQNEDTIVVGALEVFEQPLSSGEAPGSVTLRSQVQIPPMPVVPLSKAPHVSVVMLM